MCSAGLGYRIIAGITTRAVQLLRILIVLSTNTCHKKCYNYCILSVTITYYFFSEPDSRLELEQWQREDEQDEDQR